jgi:myosin heavy subunit
MKINIKKENLLPLIGVGIIVVLLFLSLFFIKTNFSLKNNLKKEKLNSEQLLSSKLLLSKEIERKKQDLESLRDRFIEINRKNEKLSSIVSEKDQRINYLSKENIALNKTKKELSDTIKQKEDIDKQFTILRLNNEELLSKMSEKEKSIASLEEKLKSLTMQLEQVALNTSNNFQISATKGKKRERLTIVAARTKKLTIDFEVPQNLTEKISFRIITPSGKSVTSDDKAMTWTFPTNPRNLTASLSGLTGEFEESRQVQLIYSPKEKLQSGLYKIEIISNNNVIGKCRVMLK